MSLKLTCDIVEACNAIKDAAIRAAKARRAEEIAHGVTLRRNDGDHEGVAPSRGDGDRQRRRQWAIHPVEGGQHR